MRLYFHGLVRSVIHFIVDINPPPLLTSTCTKATEIPVRPDSIISPQELLETIRLGYRRYVKGDYDWTLDEVFHPARGAVNVFVVPFSHNDPGWISSYEQSYSYHVVELFKHVLRHMVADRQATFVWSEIIYLRRFWENDCDQVCMDEANV